MPCSAEPWQCSAGVLAPAHLPTCPQPGLEPETLHSPVSYRQRYHCPTLIQLPGIIFLVTDVLYLWLNKPESSHLMEIAIFSWRVCDHLCAAQSQGSWLRPAVVNQVTNCALLALDTRTDTHCYMNRVNYQILQHVRI